MKRMTLVLSAVVLLGLSRPARAIDPEPGLKGPYLMILQAGEYTLPIGFFWHYTDSSRASGQWYMVIPDIVTLQGDWQMMDHTAEGWTWFGAVPGIPFELFFCVGDYSAVQDRISGFLVSPANDIVLGFLAVRIPD